MKLQPSLAPHWVQNPAASGGGGANMHPKAPWAEKSFHTAVQASIGAVRRITSATGRGIGARGRSCALRPACQPRLPPRTPRYSILRPSRGAFKQAGPRTGKMESTHDASKYGTKTATGNSRIFDCSHCDRAFTREEHLTRHILLTHNKLKPFVCGLCQRPFSRRDLLLRHAKNLHQGLEMAVLRIRKSYKKEVKKEIEPQDLKVKMSVNMLVS